MAIRGNNYNKITMTEGEFLKDWINDPENEYDEKDHHEYSEREVMDILIAWRELKEQELKKKTQSDFENYKKQVEKNNSERV